MQDEQGAQPRLRKLVVLAADLAGFTKLAGKTEAVDLALWLDRHYHAVDEIVRAHGGRVVKFMGDGVLAVFDQAHCAGAIACAEGLVALGETLDGVSMGVNVHLAQIAEAELGPQRHYDVIGMGVNATFLLGNGPGLRISEPVYRQLPNDARGPWRKQRPPTVYTRIL